MKTNFLPKLIIADDHKMFSTFFKGLLLNKGYGVLETAENGKEVINLLEHNTADLILMDYEMPIMDAIEATRIISKKHPNTNVLMLSMYSQPPYVQQALDVGAKGYIPKSADPAEIEVAIKEIRKGNVYISPSITKSLFVNKSQNEKIKLSNIDKKLLKLLAKGLTSKEISTEMELGFYTVNNYRRNLMIKFGVNNVTGLVDAARKNGFI